MGNKYTDIVVMECDTPNQNGRIYPKSVVLAAMQKYDKVISAGAAIGWFFDDAMSASLTDATHIISRVELVGDTMVADVVVMQTPKGQVLDAIMGNSDVQFGLCGIGNIDTATRMISNYEIHSINVFIETQADKAKQRKATLNYNYGRAMGIVKK